MLHEQWMCPGIHYVCMRHVRTMGETESLKIFNALLTIAHTMHVCIYIWGMYSFSVLSVANASQPTWFCRLYEFGNVAKLPIPIEHFQCVHVRNIFPWTSHVPTFIESNSDLLSITHIPANVFVVQDCKGFI